MMAMDSTQPAVAAECRSAVHIASAVSRSGAEKGANEAGAVRDLVWDSTVSCTAPLSPAGGWTAIRFAYPLPAGATFSSAADVRDGARPIEHDGRIIGIAVANGTLDPWHPFRFSIRVRTTSQGPDAKITPPLLDLLEGRTPQIIAFSSSDLSFDPRDSLEPQARASAMAITLGDVSHDAYRAALNDAKSRGLHWDGPAIVLRATRPICDQGGVSGELVERADKTHGVYIGVGIVSAAAAAGLAFLAFRFKRRSEDERAEALLRAEIDAL
ncbi:MAG TPA: hypothetical protein VNO21_17910 [Polyangiaceae bacterium]|nr:hypothetical protein [Polyangiaceae bacterium]